MKSFYILSRQAVLLGVFVISPALLLTASAQETPSATGQPQSQPSMSPGQLTGSMNSTDGAGARQKRAQGYAKLLEGQRLLSEIRRGESASPESAAGVRLAQQAFREAVQLDPSLAEAYTALAEIALFHPPQNIDEAVEHAIAALKINRDNLGAHQLLTRVYGLKSGLSKGTPDKILAERTITELREVVRLVPNETEAWALLGEFYLALGRMNEAIDALTRWGSSPPAVNPRFFRTITGGLDLDGEVAAARLGEALLRANRPREAFAAIRRALSLNPQSEEYEELLSRAVEALGTDDTIINELRSMAATDPGGATANMLLARQLSLAGRVDEAVQALRAAISRRPVTDKQGITTLRLILAQTFADALRYAEAVSVYEEILKEQGITGSSVLTNEAKRGLALGILRSIVSLHKSAGNTEQALATIERMRSLLGSDDPTIDLEQIELLRGLGKRREALQAARNARERFPQQNEFLYLEAFILTDSGQVDEAVTLLRARLSKPGAAPVTTLADFELYLRIASLYTQANRGTEGVAAARQALERAPADRADMMAAALITLSSAQERAGDTKGSEESLRRVLDREPDNATALNNLGYFLVERGERLKEALELIQRAVKAEPTNSSFLDSLGWAYFKLGQLEEAAQHLSDAARRDSASATIQEHLGDVYHRQGKKDLARAAWQKALSLTVEADEIARLKAKLGGNVK